MEDVHRTIAGLRIPEVLAVEGHSDRPVDRRAYTRALRDQGGHVEASQDGAVSPDRSDGGCGNYEGQ